jgi:hypothetical protein
MGMQGVGEGELGASAGAIARSGQILVGSSQLPAYLCEDEP